MLASTRTARATEARAQILEQASDWAGAEQAWSDCAAADAAGERHAGRGPDPHRAAPGHGDRAGG